MPPTTTEGAAAVSVTAAEDVPLVSVEVDRLLKYREVAYLLGIPAARVYEITRTGELPAVTLSDTSRARRWRLSDVQAYLRALPVVVPTAGDRRPPSPSALTRVQ